MMAAGAESVVRFGELGRCSQHSALRAFSLSSAAARPIDQQAEQTDRAGHCKEQAQAEFGELFLREGQLKSFDRTRREMKLGVAIHGPVDRIEEECLAAGISKAAVGENVSGTDDDQPSTRHTEGQ